MNRPLFYSFIFAASACITAIQSTILAQGNECSFESVVKEFDPDDAERDADESYTRGEFFFYGVADGIGPSRPGFDDVVLTKCLLADSEWKMLWVGGDSASCEGGAALTQRATRYAKLFNRKMIQLLKSEPKFACPIDLRDAR